jgi:hypothetical protein
LEQAIFTVEEGASAGVTYRQTVVNGTIGSTTPIFVPFGSVATPTATEAVTGTVEIATQAETDAGTVDAGFAVSPLKLATYSGRAKRQSTTFGDGSATQYDIAHPFATTDVSARVYIVSTGVRINCDVTTTSTSNVRLNFTAAPAASSLRVVILA